MMKNTILGFAAVLMASCTPALKVDVANTTQLERDDETVEIAWSEVAALEGVTPENVVVLNDDGEQIPSQVLFRGTDLQLCSLTEDTATVQGTIVGVEYS